MPKKDVTLAEKQLSYVKKLKTNRLAPVIANWRR
jgi:hypothetical protein